MTLTSLRAPGRANTHRTNYDNDVYQAIGLKFSTFVHIKLVANKWLL